MPGPVSDSYDPEWGTVAVADEIRGALQEVYDKLTTILDNKPPIYILDLIRMEEGEPIEAKMTEREWRLIRFALEHAGESI